MQEVRASPSRRVAALTSPELESAIGRDKRRRTLLIPLGATEQHGPHLVLATDTIIATAWAAAVAGRVDGALVAPALPYGASGEHQSFPGTLSIGHEALGKVLIELARSARHDFDRVVFVSGHAGNLDSLRRAVEQLRHEGHDAHFAVPRLAGADAHAGFTETSLLSHLDSSGVRPGLARPGSTAPLSDVLDKLRRGGVVAVSENGILGDPTDANATTGAALFEQLVADLVASLA